MNISTFEMIFINMSFRKNISLFISVVVVAGLVFSISHYHNETMECLNHAESQHITDNDLLCPICGITAFAEPVSQPSVDGLWYQESIYEINDLLLIVQPFELLPSRAPPISA